MRTELRFAPLASQVESSTLRIVFPAEVVETSPFDHAVLASTKFTIPPVGSLCVKKSKPFKKVLPL